MLESEVDERFYLRDDVVENFLRNNERLRSEGMGFRFEPQNGGGIAHTGTAAAQARRTDTFIDEKME